jgi:hypothetical protein
VGVKSSPGGNKRAVMVVEIDKDHGGSDRGSRLVPLAAGLLFLAAWFVFVVLAIQLFTWPAFRQAQ